MKKAEAEVIKKGKEKKQKKIREFIANVYACDNDELLEKLFDKIGDMNLVELGYYIGAGPISSNDRANLCCIIAQRRRYYRALERTQSKLAKMSASK